MPKPGMDPAESRMESSSLFCILCWFNLVDTKQTVMGTGYLSEACYYSHISQSYIADPQNHSDGQDETPTTSFKRHLQNCFPMQLCV
ncbi:hypothetical protein GDO78_009743 [Eleutherodactylus coqui]|uniref:Uncharacterized protein n=1 Tax=Eleutherodactylus coqui TaxID=57060 RepID=A0A8J6K7U5_ELECQ|nr:hypothetical protein GDO78_009743 [Eleutherodactylus coqui]